VFGWAELIPPGTGPLHGEVARRDDADEGVPSATAVRRTALSGIPSASLPRHGGESRCRRAGRTRHCPCPPHPGRGRTAAAGAGRRRLCRRGTVDLSAPVPAPSRPPLIWSIGASALTGWTGVWSAAIRTAVTRRTSSVTPAAAVRTARGSAACRTGGRRSAGQGVGGLPARGSAVCRPLSGHGTFGGAYGPTGVSARHSAPSPVRTV
jgi:hypothetical protein